MKKTNLFLMFLACTLAIFSFNLFNISFSPERNYVGAVSQYISIIPHFFEIVKRLKYISKSRRKMCGDRIA